MARMESTSTITFTSMYVCHCKQRWEEEVAEERVPASVGTFGCLEAFDVIKQQRKKIKGDTDQEEDSRDYFRW
jgi:hypothetical protein